jgi:murein DD-endopeptidase MepM/ murein hydrolase activator NlpD
VAAALACSLASAWSVPARAATGDAPATAASSDPLQQKLQEQMAAQAGLEATKESLAAEIAAARDQQSALATVITTNQKAIQETLVKLAAAEKKFQESSSREAAEHAAAKLALAHERQDKAVLADYVRQRYISQGQFIDYILTSNSISQMFGRASDVSHMVDRGEALTAKVQQDVVDAQKAEAAAKKDADAAAAAAAQLNAQEQTLQDQTNKAEDLVDKLSWQERQAAAEIAAADNQSLEVAQQIAATRIAQLDATIAAAETADWEAASYWIQQHLSTLPPGFAQPPASEGTAKFVWPAPGSNISQLFGPSPYPFEPPFQGFPHFHTGIDMARGAGAPILAAGDGVVVVAGFSDVGYGNHVIIAHAGGFLTLYGHLQSMLVKPGDTVSQGQVVGLMGSTGNSTGPHLHFEVRFNNTPVDPTPFLPPLPPGASGPPG